MTDITDQDRRDAREWAEDVAETFKYDDEVPRETRAAVNYILATVDAPVPTLAEELRDTARWWREGAPTWEQCCDRFESLAARAEQIEQERDDARAEVERLTAERITDPSLTLNDGSMMRPATVAREENVSPDLPDPADVKPGETWIVNIDGVEIVPGFKASVGWICYRLFDGTTKAIGDERITLVSRLVPAPRTITTREELNALPEGTVIRARGELVCERYRHRSKGLVWISAGVDEDFPVERPVLPATVLWTPEVPA